MNIALVVPAKRPKNQLKFKSIFHFSNTFTPYLIKSPIPAIPHFGLLLFQTLTIHFQIFFSNKLTSFFLFILF